MQEKTIDGTPYWTKVEEPAAQYPWLDRDEKCDVAVIGGGATGALCAQRFAEAGVDTVLISSEPVGYGMSSAALGIADYSVSGGISLLERKIGTDAAVRVFQMLRESVNRLEELCGSLAMPVETTRRDALQFTSDPRMGTAFRQEYLIERHNGFDVELIDSSEAMFDYSFELDTGLLCKNAVLEMNPYRFTQALVSDAAGRGARIYENTKVTKVYEEKDGVRLNCSTHFDICAKHVIYAYGAREAESMDISNTKTNFCLVTEPVQGFEGWKDRAVLFDITPQTVTLRTTPDNRIIICGLAARLMNLEGRFGGMLPISRIVEKKYEELDKRLRGMLKGIRAIKPAYRFSTLMPETTDNLPVIGFSPEMPSVIRALCPGENGIAFAELASRLILENYQGVKNRDINLFSKDRKENLIKA